MIFKINYVVKIFLQKKKQYSLIFISYIANCITLMENIQGCFIYKAIDENYNAWILHLELFEARGLSF